MFQTAVGTNHNLKVAWFQHIFQLAVVEFQQVVGNLELHYLAFALLQVNALKALQLFYGVMLATISWMYSCTISSAS